MVPRWKEWAALTLVVRENGVIDVENLSQLSSCHGNFSCFLSDYFQKEHSNWRWKLDQAGDLRQIRWLVTFVKDKLCKRIAIQAEIVFRSRNVHKDECHGEGHATWMTAIEGSKGQPH
jgi:hypothetical protein